MSGINSQVDDELPVVPDKRDWPRTEYGTIDWEAAFEQSDHGLIPLVEQTATASGILACGTVIIDHLFNRKGDADQRRRYDSLLREAVGQAVGDDLRRERVITLLRDIKMVRVEHAELHIARLKADAEAATERRAEDNPDDAHETEIDPDISAEAAFIEALSRLLAGRLEALRAGIKPGAIAGAPPPYPVSADFAKRFDRLVRDQFAPEMMATCRAFVLQAEHREPPERVAFILKNMEDRRSREALWQSWRIVWSELTDEQEPPEKPEVEKKGLLDRLKKKKARPAWMEEPLTLEEWEDEVERIERANRRARDIWAQLTEPHPGYRAPTDDDRTALMNLFARTSGAIAKQINAVRQIAEQGGENPGKVFTDYQQGKDIDLPLLCACCQCPQMFLKKGVLKDFLRGFPDAMKRDRFPLTAGFFADHI